MRLSYRKIRKIPEAMENRKNKRRCPSRNQNFYIKKKEILNL